MRTLMLQPLACLVAVSFLFSCTPEKEAPDPEALKKEIFETEKAFEAAAKEKGIAEAFHAFADENAVIKRENDTLILGKENIKTYYQNPDYQNASVTWSADFVDVSNDGTLAYTYGNYVWAVRDSTGQATEYKGVFHTVWKRQADGSWKYVWD